MSIDTQDMRNAGYELGRCIDCHYPILRKWMYRMVRTSSPAPLFTVLDSSTLSSRREIFFIYRDGKTGDRVTTCPNCWGKIQGEE